MDMLFEPGSVDMTIMYHGEAYLRKVAYWDVSEFPYQAVPELAEHEYALWDRFGKCYVYEKTITLERE